MLDAAHMNSRESRTEDEEDDYEDDYESDYEEDAGDEEAANLSAAGELHRSAQETNPGTASVGGSGVNDGDGGTEESFLADWDWTGKQVRRLPAAADDQPVDPASSDSDEGGKKMSERGKMRRSVARKINDVREHCENVASHKSSGGAQFYMLSPLQDPEPDDEVGRVLSKLEKMGIRDGTERHSVEVAKLIRRKAYKKVKHNMKEKLKKMQDKTSKEYGKHMERYRRFRAAFEQKREQDGRAPRFLPPEPKQRHRTSQADTPLQKGKNSKTRHKRNPPTMGETQRNEDAYSTHQPGLMRPPKKNRSRKEQGRRQRLGVNKKQSKSTRNAWTQTSMGLLVPMIAKLKAAIPKPTRSLSDFLASPVPTFFPSEDSQQFTGGMQGSASLPTLHRCAKKRQRGSSRKKMTREKDKRERVQGILLELRRVIEMDRSRAHALFQRVNHCRDGTLASGDLQFILQKLGMQTASKFACKTIIQALRRRDTDCVVNFFAICRAVRERGFPSSELVDLGLGKSKIGQLPSLASLSKPREENFARLKLGDKSSEEHTPIRQNSDQLHDLDRRSEDAPTKKDDPFPYADRVDEVSRTIRRQDHRLRDIQDALESKHLESQKQAELQKEREAKAAHEREKRMREELMQRQAAEAAIAFAKKKMEERRDRVTSQSIAADSRFLNAQLTADSGSPRKIGKDDKSIEEETRCPRHTTKETIGSFPSHTSQLDSESNNIVSQLHVKKDSTSRSFENEVEASVISTSPSPSKKNENTSSGSPHSPTKELQSTAPAMAITASIETEPRKTTSTSIGRDATPGVESSGVFAKPPKRRKKKKKKYY